jgi:hypothetical protein
MNRMSDLRKQLDAAKDQYRAARYPGNLADELLAPRRSSSIRLYIGMIGTLAAAAVVGFLLLRPAGTIKNVAPTTPTVIAQGPTSQPGNTPADEDENISLADLAAMPSFPEDVSVSTEVSTTQPANSAVAKSDDMPMAPTSASLGDLGSMPSLGSLPSMDFSLSDTTDTTSNEKTSKEST